MTYPRPQEVSVVLPNQVVYGSFQHSYFPIYPKRTTYTMLELLPFLNGERSTIEV